MKQGLWRYSRHPNYFGETLFTIGLFIIALSVHNGWITFYSPLIIILLLRYVSGVPILEAEFQKREGWTEYERETNCFIPWFPKDPVANRGIKGSEKFNPIIAVE
jgi:steroid 5-alpha reductase family enzyme